MKLILSYWKKFTQNPLLAGSFIMFIGTNIHNAGQLLYHYLSINLLSKAQYGDLAALVSIFGLVAIIQQSFALSIVKFVASSKNEIEANNLARWFFVWSLWVAGALSFLIFILSPFIVDFLRISQPNIVYLFAPMVGIAFVSNTGRALLQGFVKFTRLSGSLIVEVVTKIIFTMTFIWLGYEILGAVIGLFIGVSVGFVAVWLALKDRLLGKRKSIPEIKSIFKYSLPVLAQSLAVTSMISTDILLVKHFFAPDIAGAYAALAKFGTISLFAASPITQVMFPLIAKKFTHGGSYHRTFYLSLSIVILISTFIVGLYFFFNQTIVGILTSGKYTGESDLLGWLGFYMLLLGVSMIFIQFYLSIGKTKTVWFFVAAALLQIILIVLFHATLFSVVKASITAAALLLVSLTIYFPYHDRRRVV